MKNIVIREVETSDLPNIKKLLVELIEFVDNKEGYNASKVIENCRNLLSDKNSFLLVAELDKTIIGFINFTIRTTILHSGPSGLIDELVVTKNYQNKGVGQILTNAAIEKCTQLGCCEVEVSTEFTNTGARQFYKKCGFEENSVLLEKHL